MTKAPLNRKELAARWVAAARRLRRYNVLLFLAFVALLYGFILLRVNTLTNAEPSSDSVSSQVQAAHVPRIDPAIVKQLQSLQDNSVSVKSLFNQARNNPFQE